MFESTSCFLEATEIALNSAHSRPRFRGDERIFTSAFFPAQVCGIDF